MDSGILNDTGFNPGSWFALLTLDFCILQKKKFAYHYRIVVVVVDLDAAFFLVVVVVVVVRLGRMIIYTTVDVGMRRIPEVGRISHIPFQMDYCDVTQQCQQDKSIRR
jgi:hypothetical protein